MKPYGECLSLVRLPNPLRVLQARRQLQAAHRELPWLSTWDDHEVANNYAGLVMNPEVPLVDAKLRRAAAYLAYWEHQPLSRCRKPVDENMPIFRRAHWGDLATFHVIDTRQYRDDQIAQCGTADRDAASGYCRGQLDDQRQMLGDRAADWLVRRPRQAGRRHGVARARQPGRLRAGGHAATATSGKRFSVDSWDGYVHERQQLLDHLAAQERTNLVVITGDKHINSVRRRAAELPVASTARRSPRSSSARRSAAAASDDAAGLAPSPCNPHHLWKDLHHGYVRVELDADAWRSDFRVIDTVDAGENMTVWTETSWEVTPDEPGAGRGAGRLTPRHL